MIYSDILSYLRVIRRRWWVIVTLVACTMVVVLFSHVTAKPVYRAQVKLQVLAAERQEVYLFSQFRSTGTVDEMRAAQNDFVRQLRSSLVAWQTIADLNLSIGAYDLLSRLAIYTDGDFITLVAEADEPDVAEGIATRQAMNALEQYRKTRSTPSSVVLEFITNQLKVEEDQMLRAEEAMIAFKREHNLEDLSRELTSYQDMLRSLRQQTDQAAIAQEQLLARAELEREEAKRLRKQADEVPATATYTAQSLREQAAKYEELANSHEFDAAVQGRVVEAYKKTMAEREAEMKALLTLSASYNALQRTLDQARGNYDFLVSKFNEARLKESQAKNLGFIQIVEGASKPSEPVRSNFGRLLLMGLAASILGGVVIAFALEAVDSLRKRFGLLGSSQ